MSDWHANNNESGRGPACPCGAPVAVTIRRRHTFGVGPVEWLCVQCAPAPTECAPGDWRDFFEAGRDAETARRKAGA